MKNLIIAVLCLLIYGTASAQIGEVKKTTSTNYDIYDASGKYIGKIRSWSNCDMMGYTSKYVVIWCDSYSTYVYDHKGNQVASKSSNTGCGKCTVVSVTSSGITFKKENGDKRLYDFKLSPK